MKHKFKGLRLLSNLSCQYKCSFCYQKSKPNKVLSLDQIKDALKDYNFGDFEYATIMGGESTLLGYNLGSYITLASLFSNGNVRLTTNAYLLNRELLSYYRKCGLNGINISIATINRYQETTNCPGKEGEGLGNALRMMTLSKFGNLDTRINIALCKENMVPSEFKRIDAERESVFETELQMMLDHFLRIFDVGVTICEDVLESFSLVKTPEKMNAELIEDTGTGLLFYKHLPSGKRFGYYHHTENYKKSDLIVTPIGTFTMWNDFCEAVGLNYNNK